MPSFSDIFDAAFDRAQEIFCRVNNLSGYHDTYRGLCFRLWTSEDPLRTGYFTTLGQCDTFAKNMVVAGWPEWEQDKIQRERAIWEALLAIHKRISIMEFLCSNEDPNYPMPEPAQITPAHEEWKKQGGANPSKPTKGAAQFRVIDWSQPDKDKLAAEVVAALKADGFFCIVNHGVPLELVSNTMYMSREFFARRRRAKSDQELENIRVREATRPMMKCARGYSDFGEEALNPIQGPDIKETFDYSLQKEDQKKKKGTAGNSCSIALGENLWPAENDKQFTNVMAENAAKGVPNQPPQPVFRSYNPNAVAQKHEALAPIGFRDTCETYIDRVYQLSRELLHIICKGLGLSQEVVEREILPMFEEPLVVNRLLHYTPTPPGGWPQVNTSGIREISPGVFGVAKAKGPPPPLKGGNVPAFFAPNTMPGAREVSPGVFVHDPSSGVSLTGTRTGAPLPTAEPGQHSMSAGAHIDYGFATIIFEDSPGIEVQRRGDPSLPYESIRHVPGAAIINTGFVLEKLTNGILPATRHRVQNMNASDRYSIALFLDPNPEATIAPLKEFIKDGETAKYEPCKSGHKGVRFGNPEYLKIAGNRP